MYSSRHYNNSVKSRVLNNIILIFYTDLILNSKNKRQSGVIISDNCLILSKLHSGTIFTTNSAIISIHIYVHIISFVARINF